ncbi:MAG: hypothetical protein H7Y42_12315 [Chitinophagaceae bacterium]|nr:hypothetical protein [Chitinophagaceae bacterium]
MGQTNLANTATTVDTSNDSIVIVDNFQSIRGGRSLVTTGFTPAVIPGGHVIIKETSTGELKPMPATDAAPAGVATVDTLVAGTGYTNGTYENVPLSGGSGTGVLATVVVALTVVSTVTITKPGTGYAVNDTLVIPGAYAGGTATTNASVDVATLADVAAAYGALPAGHTYHGINISSILTAKPMAGVMVRGTVNPSASKYSLSSILAAVKTALPLIDFRAD